MASEAEHAQDCVRALGEPFIRVHRWLDEFMAAVGPDHRVFRHHEGGVEEVRQMWGDRAAEAARIHIIRDCGEVPPKDDLSKLWVRGS
jgi:DNA-binding GntR family transcriptional regulator